MPYRLPAFAPRLGLRLLAALLLLLGLLLATRPAQAAPTSIVYTGQLLTSTSPPTPANGTYDFQFQLFNAATGGTQVGPTVSLASVPVVDGVYQVQLSFGNVFTGQTVWLQVSYRVHPASGNPPYKTVSPRLVAPNSAFADYATLSGSTQGLQSKAVSAAYPTTGQVLTYNGTLWAPGLVGPSDLALPLTLSAPSDTPLLSVNNTGNGDGVFGQSTNGTGVFGVNTSNGDFGILGDPDNYGVYGQSTSGKGVYGFSFSGPGVSASGGGTSINNPAIYATNTNSAGIGLFSVTSSTDANLVVANDGPGDQIKAFNAGSLEFEVGNVGDVYVAGSLNVSGNKNFEIDHPLHPDTMTLKHACIESSLPENVYNGEVTTDAHGDATVTLPDYFEALNKNPLYQLTVIGQFAQAVVATRVKNNAFTIKTDHPDVAVCWQVTGERNDAYQKAHPYHAEEPKAAKDQGKYLDPADYGQPADMGIGYAEVQAPARPAASAARP